MVHRTAWRTVPFLVCVLPAAACVQTDFVPLSELDPFPTELRLPEDDPVERPTGGHLTTVDPGQTTLIEGWVDRVDARLVVVLDQPGEVLSVRRLAGLPSPEAEPLLPDTAFRVQVRSSGQPAERVCVLSESSAGTKVLTGSDPSLCPVS